MVISQMKLFKKHSLANPEIELEPYCEIESDV
jgi:hypothetical protein